MEISNPILGARPGYVGSGWRCKGKQDLDMARRGANCPLYLSHAPATYFLLLPASDGALRQEDGGGKLTSSR